MLNAKLNRRTFLRVSAASLGSAAVASLPGPARAGAPKRLRALQAADFVQAGDMMLKKQMEDWGKANGFDVDLEIVSSPSLPAKIAAAMTVQGGPDIVIIKEADAWIYAHSLADLTQLVERAKKKLGEVYPTADAHNRVNNVYRAVPFLCTPQGWIYRSDWFAQAGFPQFPKSMDEFLAAGKKLKAAKHPIGVSLAANCGDARSFWYSTIWNMGGMEQDKNGKVVINSPETLKAIEWAREFLREAADPAGFGWDESGNNRAYAAKTISCTNNAPSIYVNALKNDPELGKVTALAPAVTGPGGAYFNFGTKNYTITRWSPYKDAAQELIYHMLQPEQLQEFLKVSAGQNQGAYAYYKEHLNPIFTNDPKLLSFLKVFEQGRWQGYAGAPDARSALAWQQDIIVNMFSSVHGGTSPKEALDRAERLLKQIYV